MFPFQAVIVKLANANVNIYIRQQHEMVIWQQIGQQRNVKQINPARTLCDWMENEMEKYSKCEGYPQEIPGSPTKPWLV